MRRPHGLPRFVAVMTSVACSPSLVSVACWIALLLPLIAVPRCVALASARYCQSVQRSGVVYGISERVPPDAGWCLQA